MPKNWHAKKEGDVKSIQVAQGVGKKTAERIVLELKDKMNIVAGGETATVVENIQSQVVGSNSSEAIEVLVSLGFNQSDAALVVSKFDPKMSVDDMIRKGLQSLSSNL